MWEAYPRSAAELSTRVQNEMDFGVAQVPGESTLIRRGRPAAHPRSVMGLARLITFLVLLLRELDPLFGNVLRTDAATACTRYFQS